MVRTIVATHGEHIPVRLWGRAIPSGALKQLLRIAAQPYVVEHVAAMPDLHMAEGIAVGTVFATDSTVVPMALGGDLGCGMSAIRFPTPAASLPRQALEALLLRMSAAIPVGDAVHRGKDLPIPDPLLSGTLSTGSLEHERGRLIGRHLGTLGGGNHFIELDRDGGGDLWLLVHSGSRGLGACIAAHHLRVAEAEGVGELPGLSVAAEVGRACLSDIEWALSFARANRDALLSVAGRLITEEIGVAPDACTRIDVHHNFVRKETHLGRSLLIHRKGAIAAPPGALALIPGSMATASYIVEGLGEEAALGSASHGSGRRLTRREARQAIKPKELLHAMRRVVFDERKTRSLVEEGPTAYRDISEVLEDEADLVRPVLRLTPIAVLKG